MIIFFRSVLLLGLTFVLPAQAVVFTFSGTALGRYAHHTNSKPGGPASQRLELNLQQKIALPPRWTIMVAGRGFFENVYNASKEIYPEALRNQDGHELRLQDTYLEYKSGKILTRFGNQQVVWGETFGNLYADIVNPRDLREGVPLDSISSRRSVPMAFGKYIAETFSVEALVLPRPEFHVLPLPGSDFAPISTEEVPYKSVNVERERYWWGTEYGMRGSTTFGTTDVSAFYMNHYDRYPYYELAPGTIPGTNLNLRERHARISTIGLGAASEINGYVARVELVRNTGRLAPVRAPASIDFVTTDEEIGVLSVDLPSWRRFNFSLQVSNSRFIADKQYITRDRDQSYGGARVVVSLFRSSNLELLAAKSFSDQGTRLQTDFMTPLTSSLEIHFGGEAYSGPRTSEYGRMHEAGRVYVSLKSYLSALPENALSKYSR